MFCVLRVADLRLVLLSYRWTRTDRFVLWNGIVNSFVRSFVSVTWIPRFFFWSYIVGGVDDDIESKSCCESMIRCRALPSVVYILYSFTFTFTFTFTFYVPNPKSESNYPS